MLALMSLDLRREARLEITRFLFSLPNIRGAPGTTLCVSNTEMTSVPRVGSFLVDIPAVGGVGSWSTDTLLPLPACLSVLAGFPSPVFRICRPLCPSSVPTVS